MICMSCNSIFSIYRRSQFKLEKGILKLVVSVRIHLSKSPIAASDFGF